MATYCLILRISRSQASSFFTFPVSTTPWKEALRNWCARKNWYHSSSVILRGSTCFPRYQRLGTFRWLTCWWKQYFGRAVRRSILSLLTGAVFVRNASLKRVLCHADVVQSRDQESLTFDLEKEEPSLRERTALIIRLAFLMILFCPAMLLQLVNWFLASNVLYSLQWWFTVSAIEIAGPAFIKLGQWASTRRDLFPEEFCDRLSTLQRRCSPHPWLATEEVLRDSFGENWKDHFTDINGVPIGCGCVAQVYKWSLKKRVLHSSMSALMESEEHHSSISVAVKVLHPGIIVSVKRDIGLMRLVACWIDAMFPDVYWISLKEGVEEFAAIMWKQVS